MLVTVALFLRKGIFNSPDELHDTANFICLVICLWAFVVLSTEFGFPNRASYKPVMVGGPGWSLRIHTFGERRVEECAEVTIADDTLVRLIRWEWTRIDVRYIRGTVFPLGERLCIGRQKCASVGDTRQTIKTIRRHYWVWSI